MSGITELDPLGSFFPLEPVGRITRIRRRPADAERLEIWPPGPVPSEDTLVDAERKLVA